MQREGIKVRHSMVTIIANVLLVTTHLHSIHTNVGDDECANATITMTITMTENEGSIASVLQNTGVVVGVAIGVIVAIAVAITIIIFVIIILHHKNRHDTVDAK